MSKKLLLFILILIVLRGTAQQRDSVIYAFKMEGGWLNSTLNEIVYNSDCKAVLFYVKDWDTINNAWKPAAAFRTFRYDDAGNLSEMLNQTLDPVTNKYRNSSMEKYIYKKQGSEQWHTFYKWDTITNAWYPFYNIIHIYNNAGLVVSEESDQYVNDKLSKQTKKLYHYDAYQRVDKSQFLQWNNNAWDTLFKYITQFDNENNSRQMEYTRKSDTWKKSGRFIDRHTIAYSQYWTGYSWTNNYQDKYTYDDKDRLTESFTQRWNENQKDWINLTKYTVDYYDDGAVRKTIEEWWDDSLNAWTWILRATYTHNGCASLLLKGADKADADIAMKAVKSGELKIPSNIHNAKNIKAGYLLHILPVTKKFSQEVTNDLNIQQANDFTVAPNPARNYFNISLGKNITAATLTITDTYGKMILQQKITGGNNQSIFVHGLTKGIYFVNIVSDKKLKSQKLVIY